MRFRIDYRFLTFLSPINPNSLIQIQNRIERPHLPYHLNDCQFIRRKGVKSPQSSRQNTGKSRSSITTIGRFISGRVSWRIFSRKIWDCISNSISKNLIMEWTSRTKKYRKRSRRFIPCHALKTIWPNSSKWKRPLWMTTLSKIGLRLKDDFHLVSESRVRTRPTKKIDKMRKTQKDWLGLKAILQ